MNCARVAAVLTALSRGALAATPAELAELTKAGLVVSINAPALHVTTELAEMGERRGGMTGAAIGALLEPRWLWAALRKLESELRSELHRGVTSSEHLWQEEADRAQMRRLLGLITDPRRVAEIRDALAARAQAGRSPLVPCPPGHALVALSPSGARLLSGLGPRLSRCGEEPLPSFLKRFNKAEAQMASMAQTAARIRDGVGSVPKGKAQVVIGLLKTGLPADQALSAYQRSYQLASRSPPKERPHMAVTYARGAQGGAVDGAPAKLNLARGLVNGFAYGVSDEARAAMARALMPFPSPDQGLERLKALCQAMMDRRMFGRDDCGKYAARLMGAKGDPLQVIDRLQKVAGKLRTPPRNNPRFWPVVLALTGAIVDDAATAQAVDRFEALLSAVSAAKLPHGVDPHDTALALAPCPGSPEELVHLLAQSAYAFSGGQPLQAEHVQMASAFAKRFVY